MLNDEPLSKVELALIDKIIVAAGLAKFRTILWQKVRQAFGFSFHGTNIEYGFARASPDERALAYLEDRIFILSDKTQAKLVGDLRWELLEGMKASESIDEIKRRLDGIFEGNTVNTERIARTEVLNAQNAGRYQAHVESGVADYKQWQAAINNPRTAVDSKRLHGQVQEIENPFIDPLNGDSFMHPPNRPNCRCTALYLRKLPPNIVRKGGQMYNADVMIGKIEIDIGSLSKGEKRVWIKPTSKRKGHYRKIKGAKDNISERKNLVKVVDWLDSHMRSQTGIRPSKDIIRIIKDHNWKYTGKVYRGISGMFGENDKIIERKDFSSWTSNKNVAISFAIIGAYDHWLISDINEYFPNIEQRVKERYKSGWAGKGTVLECDVHNAIDIGKMQNELDESLVSDYAANKLPMLHESEILSLNPVKTKITKHYRTGEVKE